MAEVIEVTGKILFEIRDEIKNTRIELKQEIEKTNQRLDGVEKDISEMKEDIAGIRTDIKAIYGFFQQDMMKLAITILCVCD